MKGWGGATLPINKMKKNKREVKVFFAPSFAQSFLDNIPEKDREEVLQGLNEAIEQLKKNPYSGTPESGGFFNPIFVFVNWVKRILYKIGLID